MSINRRQALQGWLTERLTSLEFRYSGGDEFELRLPLNETTLREPWRLRLELATGVWADEPVRLRYGLGVGPVWITSAQGPYGEDGPAYHAAREAFLSVRDRLSLAARRDVTRPWSPAAWSAMTAVHHASRPEVNAALTSLVSLMDILSQRWTREQREVIIRLFQGHNYQRIATDLGVLPSSVAMRLRASHLDPFLFAQQALNNLLLPATES